MAEYCREAIHTIYVGRVADAAADDADCLIRDAFARKERMGVILSACMVLIR